MQHAAEEVLGFLGCREEVEVGCKKYTEAVCHKRREKQCSTVEVYARAVLCDLSTSKSNWSTLTVIGTIGVGTDEM